MNDAHTISDSSPETAEGVSVLFPVTAFVRYFPYVAGLGLIVGLAAGFQSLLTPRMYEVTSSFVTERAEPRSGGAAGSLLGQLGVVFSGPDSESPRFFADLIMSREIMLATLHRNVTSPGDNGTERGFLVFHALGGERITEPEEIRRAIRTLRSMINTQVSATGVVTVQVRSESPATAEAVAIALMDLLNRFNLERRQGRAQQERAFVEERAREQEARLREAESDLQRFLQQNRAFQNSPELLFEHDRLQRKVNMRQQLVTALLESSERARIEEVRNLPVLTLVDGPEGAAEPRPRHTVLRVIAGVLFGAALGWVAGMVRLSWIRLREGGDPAVLELRGAWSGLRSILPR